MTVVRLLLEFATTRRITHTARIRTVPLVDIGSAGDFLREEWTGLLLMASVLFFASIELREIKDIGLGMYLKSFWNILEVLQLSFLTVRVQRGGGLSCLLRVFRFISCRALFAQSYLILKWIHLADMQGKWDDAVDASVCLRAPASPCYFVDLNPLAWFSQAVYNMASVTACVPAGCLHDLSASFVSDFLPVFPPPQHLFALEDVQVLAPERADEHHVAHPVHSSPGFAGVHRHFFCRVFGVHRHGVPCLWGTCASGAVFDADASLA